MQKLKNKLELLVAIMCMFIIASPVKADTYNNYRNVSYKCGSGFITHIPEMVPKIISYAYNFMLVLVPVLLVIFSLINFLKAIVAQKDENIKAAYKIFIKKLINAVFVFFVLVVVRGIISIAADTSKVMNCAECFVKGPNSEFCVKEK